MRSHWSGKIAFILAATGSAVGLGNIWKFPYITGVNGGGAFVLIYLLSIAVVGFSGLIAELSIGQKSQANAVTAFEKLHKTGSVFKLAGYMGVFSSLLILAFYSVVGGWILAYLEMTVSGTINAMSDVEVSSSLETLMASPSKLVGWHTLFMAATLAIINGGVAKGIEKWSKILMPALFLLLIGLLLFSTQLTGFSKAISFLFAPNFELLTPEGILEAVGHSFFSLSLGIGAMITYGSYLNKDDNSLLSTGLWICVLDTLVALIAGIVIFSVTFTYDYSPASGPGLMFGTMPLLFRQMTGGYWLLIAFFTLVIFAALTSSIALLEVMTSFVCDRWQITRKKACYLIGTITWFAGLLCALSFNVFQGTVNFFDLFDKATSSIMMPLFGIATALFMGWIVGENELIKILGARSSNIFSKSLLWILRIVTPLAVSVLLIQALFDWIGGA